MYRIASSKVKLLRCIQASLCVRNRALMQNALRISGFNATSSSPKSVLVKSRSISSETIGDSKQPYEVYYEDLVNFKKDGKLTLVDVREHEEVANKDPVPDSIHVPLSELKTALQMTPQDFESKYGFKMPEKGRPVVFSCGDRTENLIAVKWAWDLGYVRPRFYKGGFGGWYQDCATILCNYEADKSEN